MCASASVYCFQYTLETFTEARSTSRKQKPYHGGILDGPENGAAPLPWQIQVQPATPFQESTQIVTVPHTDTVKVGVHSRSSISTL